MQKAKLFSARLLIMLMIFAAVPAVANEYGPDGTCTTCPMVIEPPPPDTPCSYRYCYQVTTYSEDGHTVTVQWICHCY